MPYVCGDMDSREFSGGMAILAVTDGGLEWSTQFADISTPVCLPSKDMYTCNIPAGCSAYCLCFTGAGVSNKFVGADARTLGTSDP